MKITSLHYPVVALLISLLCFIVACATDQGATSEKKPRQKVTREERSRQEWEDRVLETTWYEGAEYNRQRDDSRGFDIGEWLRTRRELKAKQEETEKRLAKLEKQAKGQEASGTQEQKVATQAAAAASAPVPHRPQKLAPQQGLRFKVVLVVLPEVYGTAPDTKTELFEVATAQFAYHPWFFLVDPEETEEILAQQGLVINEKNMAKIGQTLGVYPAARLVVFVNSLALKRQSNNKEGRLSSTLVDGFSGRIVSRDEEIAPMETGASGREELLHELMARTVLDLEKRAVKYGWSSRVAMVEGKRVFLSAGMATGLKEGDIFAVYGPGREIIHPIAKVSMGFQRGPYKGTIKVLNLFGDDAAEATLVAGSGKIEVNDVVVFPEKPK